MYLRHFYDIALAQASYLIGCQRTGAAIVVDPNRDAEQYASAAAAEGLHIAFVTETHIHADFVSGSRELQHRTGAELLLSGEGGAHWQYDFAHDSNARLLEDGDEFMVGTVRFQVLHTPGHTPEHISLIVTDTAATTLPMGVITGDFVFVGDVGRPDLLERAAGVSGTMEAGARSLFHSLQRFRQLPPHLQIWPGHGPGSACGKSLGAVPSSTVGYESLVNWGLTTGDEDDFVRAVLAGQPEPPPYFGRMKRVNKAGPPILGRMPRPPRLPDAELGAAVDRGAFVIDVRSAPAFAAGSVPGTVNLPLDRSFTTWAGWVVPYDEPLYLVVDDACDDCTIDAARALAMIGLDHVVGSFGTSALAGWAATRGRPLDVIPQIDAPAAAARIAERDVLVLDVRNESEWRAGHIPGSLNAPLGRVAERVDGVARERPILVHCQSGTRSAIAASLLRARGFTDVTNMGVGYAGWARGGLPSESSTAAAGGTGASPDRA